MLQARPEMMRIYPPPLPPPQRPLLSPSLAKRGKGEFEKGVATNYFQAGKIIKREKGFTLIELILAIVIVGIIAIAMTMAFVPTMKVSVAVDTRKEALQSGRLAMERMLREIREARSISAGFSATSLTFTNASNSAITYSLIGTSIQRIVGGVPSDVTCCIQGLTFTYLNKGGTTTTDPLQVWRIQADLQIKVGDETVELRSEVNPRNIY